MEEELDLSFLIKNLDTGEQVDARDESHIDVMLSYLTPTIHTSCVNVDLWKEFWEGVKDLNEKLWDAGIFEIFILKLNLETQILSFSWCKIKMIFVRIIVL